MTPAEIRILVVDDDPDILAGTARLLAKAGYAVDRAATGQASLQAVQDPQPDLLLLDRHLPDLDGLEVCRRIKQDPTLADIFVVLISGSYTKTDDQAEGLESGADGYITRPIANRELLARVEACVRILRLTRSLRVQAEALQQSNAAVCQAQLAAQALMEEAVASRNRLAAANRKLQHEISERQQAEAALRETTQALRRNERRLSLAISATADAVWEWNLKTNETYYSPRWYEMLGYADQQFAMDFDTWKRLCHPDDLQPATDRIQATLGAPQSCGYAAEFRARKADGSWIWILERGNVVERDAEGKPGLLSGTSTDITERKQVEQSLTRLATAVEQATEAIVITDPQATILYANPAFERTTGYTRPEVLGQNPRFLKSGKHDVQFYRQMWGVLKRGAAWQGHFINRRKDGTLYDEEATISPVRDSAGRIVNYVAVKRDVTREVQLESQLRQAQKWEAVGQLAGGVAHDFNNILAAIMMSLGLLQLNPALTGETRRTLKDLEAEAQRAAALIRQLLMFSRRSVLAVRPIDLNEVVANLHKMLGRLIGEHIDLRFDGKTGLPPVEADAGMLEQVLVNLVVNARDALSKGGRITISSAPAEVGEADAAAHPERRCGHFVCLAVSDTGCGMDAALLKRIFEPFFTTKEAGIGTGLGLATVHGIVAQHKGWVEVQSQVGQGTTFRVFLPALNRSAALEVAAAPVKPLRGGRETILLAEDDAKVRQLIGQSLRVLGYRVYAAANGPEALRLWQKHGMEVDLLLTDMVMPEGMTGLELTARLQALKPGLKAILSSGYSAQIAQAGLPDKTGVVYLPKPYETRTLAEVVRNCLDRQG
jgi:PAS domain S-box-containing protein